MTDDTEQRPDSLLPYDTWTEEALRHVMVRAIKHVAAQGLPGEHHFYVTFRTDHPQASVPARLRAQYPQEMTIVLQHQYWDLAVDDTDSSFSIGLSFGGVPTILTVPFEAVTAFADPHVRYGLRFNTKPADATPPDATAADTRPLALVDAKPDAMPDKQPESRPEEGEVVSLDAFRRRSPPKES